LIRRENVFRTTVKVSEVRVLEVLLIHIDHPCTPSPFRQPLPARAPVPSPLASKLTPPRRCAPRRSLRVPPPLPPVVCVSGAPSPTLFCATAALQLPPPPAQHQPPSPARITGFARSPQVCALPSAATAALPPPPVVYASAAGTAAAPVAAFTLLSNELPPPARASGLRPPTGTHAAAAAARGACPGYSRPRHDLRRRSRGCFNPTTE
jgi:hypothetical protein